MSQRLLRRAIEEALSFEGVRPRSVEVSVVLTDDAELRDLNARYRQIDRATDVLSFSQDKDLVMPGAPTLLGDIVISLDTALIQAQAGGRSLDDEVAHLAIHGVLHLLGYDDATTEGYAEMVRKGAAIWERLQQRAADGPDAPSLQESNEQ